MHIRRGSLSSLHRSRRNQLYFYVPLRRLKMKVFIRSQGVEPVQERDVYLHFIRPVNANQWNRPLVRTFWDLFRTIWRNDRHHVRWDKAALLLPDGCEPGFMIGSPDSIDTRWNTILSILMEFSTSMVLRFFLSVLYWFSLFTMKMYIMYQKSQWAIEYSVRLTGLWIYGLNFEVQLKTQSEF